MVAGAVSGASFFGLPPPGPLEIHDAQASGRWKNSCLHGGAIRWRLQQKCRRQEYNRAGLEEIWRILRTKTKCPVRHYRFNRRVQEPGESYDQYKTALRKLADGCEFDSITPEEILRD
ncbi:predicted protein [Nematostella vectensis]|uniref:Uncharacterized protein n=1 Tax=Nematostella vectensis TaxID=45351 RepID=A7SKH2_NEMVE|nr:predicted protein [Nematostella vectensis]|eukprot:XP_001627855.1 predicted protein [Nematostella vectensis]